MCFKKCCSVYKKSIGGIKTQIAKEGNTFKTKGIVSMIRSRKSRNTLPEINFKLSRKLKTDQAKTGATSKELTRNCNNPLFPRRRKPTY